MISIKTAHDTLLVLFSDRTELGHLPIEVATDHNIIDLSHALNGLDQLIEIEDGKKIEEGPLYGYTIFNAIDGNGFHLMKDGFYLCAEKNSNSIKCNRLNAGAWERFTMYSSESQSTQKLNSDQLAPLIRNALQQYNYGNLHNALLEFQKIQMFDQDNQEAFFYLRIIKDLLYPNYGPNKRYLVWQGNPTGLWENDWIKYLVDDQVDQHIQDAQHSIFHKEMIIIDNRIGQKQTAYYKEAFKRGCRICLIHISDEFFEDDYSCYQWCTSVWRNCWSPILSRNPSIHFFPLGYKSGFSGSSLTTTNLPRKFTWSFAGDIKKSTRAEMINAMRLISGGFTHFTESFGSSDALPVTNYRDVMESSIFVPCPAGNVNLDSFRVYEALEAGCIPIVEKRIGFDYFQGIFGTHPMPTIQKWDDAIPLIQGLLSQNAHEELRLKCQAWWEREKVNLKRNLACSFLRLRQSRV